jgi:hypothetical protein
MSIEVVCPSCDTSHKVKDESAGKKLKCKGCQKILAIPAKAEAAEGDPWDNLDENEGGEELPPVVRPSAASKKKTGKRARASSGDGMPVPIMVSIGINAVQVGVMLIIITINLIAGNFKGLPGGLRIAIDIGLINGLRARNSRSRWQAIILDGIGLGFAVLVGFLFIVSTQLGGGGQNAPKDGPSKEMVIAIGVTQAIFWLVDLIMLLTPSAKNYCNES